MQLCKVPLQPHERSQCVDSRNKSATDQQERCKWGLNHGHMPLLFKLVIQNDSQKKVQSK